MLELEALGGTADFSGALELDLVARLRTARGTDDGFFVFRSTAFAVTVATTLRPWSRFGARLSSRTNLLIPLVTARIFALSSNTRSAIR